jgi:hypothetical protein
VRNSDHILAVRRRLYLRWSFTTLAHPGANVEDEIWPQKKLNNAPRHLSLLGRGFTIVLGLPLMAGSRAQRQRTRPHGHGGAVGKNRDIRALFKVHKRLPATAVTVRYSPRIKEGAARGFSRMTVQRKRICCRVKS